ncbi:MAG: ChbG/HpnK family deacetylase [Phreatobacter sp.]|uniref:ChbG/HpnK family deacetylase n=1 Tax=Phreatobacter sp. TaxID=1966341 RepID=UPI001A602304|nr:ChbG/HpnK family deacetylase [Phreatobacter sp.]MBL8569237.1 ChbG/HpnK family deacetylase [Phreatobacter sp.]
MKRLILCADDYALAPGVSRAIRELVAAGRLNATSVMTPGPDLAAEAEALLAAAPPGFQIGLHVTLTGGLTPLAAPDLPAFWPSIAPLMAAAFLRRLDRAAVAAEIGAQFGAFRSALGRAPDFVDGHQHAHLLPGIRDLVLDAAKRHAPYAWVRQCRGPHGAGQGLKGRIIAGLSGGLARAAAARGIATNPAFSGAYDFARAGTFPAIFRGFLPALPDGSLVMVHPGHVDAALKRVDPVHEPRERELAYLAGDAFPQDLAAAGFSLGLRAINTP